MLEKTQLVWFDWSNNTVASDVKINGSVLEERPFFKILQLTFFSKLDWGCYIIFIVKTAPQKIGTLIRSMKFLSSKFALYLYKSTIQSSIEYCCNVWTAPSNYYSELLDKLEKRVSRTAGISVTASLNPWLIIEMSPAQVLSIGITLVDVHLSWLNWFHFLILVRSLLFILIACMIFLSPLLDVSRMSMSTVSFLRQPDSGILCL